MSKPVFTKDDTLPHIDATAGGRDADDPKSWRNQVSSTDGEITILSAFGCSLILIYSFSPDALVVQLVLDTPFGRATLADAVLDAANPTVVIGGSFHGFKAEARISLDIGQWIILVAGEVCAPLLGCKSGSVTIHV